MPALGGWEYSEDQGERTIWALLSSFIYNEQFIILSVGFATITYSST